MSEPDFTRFTVMVVEDDVSLREILCVYLESYGFQTLPVGEGLAALENLKAEVDLMVLDLQLPDLDGLEVIRLTREVSSVPILVLSARGAADDRPRALAGGADTYMSKPFVPREFMARVRALIPGTTSGVRSPRWLRLQDVK